MGVFSDYKIKWQGQELIIPANRMLMAIATVEEVITVDQLARYNQQRTLPQAKLSMAYGALLRYAGARVSDEEVFESMFGDGGAETMTAAVVGLLQLMIPPSAYSDKVPGGNASAAVVNSSKKPTKQRSRNSKQSPPISSGV